MSRILEADRQAQWRERAEQGADWEGRQSAKKTALQRLKPELTEQEWHAGLRCIEEAGPIFGIRVRDDVVVDHCASDYGMAAKLTAMRLHENARQATFRRSGIAKAGACLDGVANLLTLPELALALNLVRSRGPLRPREPDTRTLKPMLRLVLISLAEHYAEVDQQKTVLGPLDAGGPTAACFRY